MTDDGRLYAAFSDVAAVRQALQNLLASGVVRTQVEVRSSVPIPEHELPTEFGVHTRVPWMAAVGGLVGGFGLFMLAKITAEAYPLPTGAMEIVALPAIGIIAFEGAAIGALLFTLATVFLEGGLPKLRHRAGPLDQHIAAGHIVVSAPSAQDRVDWTSGAVATETG